MGPKVDAVTADSALPPKADVVVVGGGIIGVSAAFYLAQKGVSVALCEKGPIAGEQSSRNWGWVRKTGRDSRELPLIIESLRLWEGLNKAVGSETGFRRAGILFASNDDAQLARYERWLEHARTYQLDSHMIGGDKVVDLMPGAQQRFKAALYTPSDGRAEPQMAAPAIARAAQAKGAVVLTECAVRGFETRAGIISGVVTERGRIDCECVILASGAWSRLLCGGLGLRLPQLKVKATVQRTSPIDAGIDPAVATAKVALRKCLDGGYSVATAGVNIAELVPDSFRFFFDFLPVLRTEYPSLRFRLGARFAQEWKMARYRDLDGISPYEESRVLDPDPHRPTNRATKQALDDLFPVFKNAAIVQEWAGLIDITPDAVPVISRVDEVPGLVIATGFSGHGFGIGPGAGRLAADFATDDPPIVDPQPLRFSRFSDGSKIEVQSWL